MAKRPHLKNHNTPVTIDADGRAITGTWGVWAGRITVYSDSESTGPGRSLKIGGPTPSK